MSSIKELKGSISENVAPSVDVPMEKVLFNPFEGISDEELAKLHSQVDKWQEFEMPIEKKIPVIEVTDPNDCVALMRLQPQWDTQEVHEGIPVLDGVEPQLDEKNLLNHEPSHTSSTTKSDEGDLNLDSTNLKNGPTTTLGIINKAAFTALPPVIAGAIGFNFSETLLGSTNWLMVGGLVSLTLPYAISHFPKEIPEKLGIKNSILENKLFLVSKLKLGVATTTAFLAFALGNQFISTATNFIEKAKNLLPEFPKIERKGPILSEPTPTPEITPKPTPACNLKDPFCSDRINPEMQTLKSDLKIDNSVKENSKIPTNNIDIAKTVPSKETQRVETKNSPATTQKNNLLQANTQPTVKLGNSTPSKTSKIVGQPVTSKPSKPLLDKKGTTQSTIGKNRQVIEKEMLQARKLNSNKSVAQKTKSSPATPAKKGKKGL